jgi:hypothetical protein
VAAPPARYRRHHPHFRRRRSHRPLALRPAGGGTYPAEPQALLASAYRHYPHSAGSHRPDAPRASQSKVGRGSLKDARGGAKSWPCATASPSQRPVRGQSAISAASDATAANGDNGHIARAHRAAAVELHGAYSGTRSTIASTRVCRWSRASSRPAAVHVSQDLTKIRIYK